MRSRFISPLVAFVIALLGLGASLASLVDYLSPLPTFCSAAGCETVHASVWAHPFGIPLPFFGVAYFATMIASLFVPRPRLRIATALLGGVIALALIALQAFVIGAWCKLCLVCDGAALALALVAMGSTTTLRPSWRLAFASGPAVLAFPLLLLLAKPVATPVAPAVSNVERAAAGTVAVVEFTDFECPFCRKLAPVLASAIAHAHKPTTVIRKMVPLSMHPHARTAALAWCCAAAQGYGDAMADALYAAPTEQLTPDGCEAIAVSVGCDRTRYRASLADPGTSDRVTSDLAEANAAGVHALPTVFIADQRLLGTNHSEAEYVAAIERGAVLGGSR